MTRIKRGFKANRRRKKILKLAKGFFGGRSRLYKTAKETVHRALSFAYRDRKVKKRMFRKLWIIRINAAARLYNLTYSTLIYKLKCQNIILNRKQLACLANSNIEDFKSIVDLLVIDS